MNKSEYMLLLKKQMTKRQFKQEMRKNRIAIPFNTGSRTFKSKRDELFRSQWKMECKNY